eukprot:SAG11_NODE_10506_length_826_cov_0.579092_1_plen_124_part_10
MWAGKIRARQPCYNTPYGSIDDIGAAVRAERAEALSPPGISLGEMADQALANVDVVAAKAQSARALDRQKVSEGREAALDGRNGRSPSGGGFSTVDIHARVPITFVLNGYPITVPAVGTEYTDA